MAALKHLAIRNPKLAYPERFLKMEGFVPHPGGRKGCWNTTILTACGELTQPDDSSRQVTSRLDLVTCPGCKLWAGSNQDKLKDDGLGHLVTA